MLCFVFVTKMFVNACEYLQFRARVPCNVRERRAPLRTKISCEDTRGVSWRKMHRGEGGGIAVEATVKIFRIFCVFRNREKEQEKNIRDRAISHRIESGERSRPTRCER